MDILELTVYDPESATARGGALDDLALDITLKDLARPESAKLLVLMLRSSQSVSRNV
ncbi:MAG TPA: hypothetical protein VFJ58_01340 [Armatimonadota bacterium]|nr:hypothetical protein [Armatimonadota bacterium]